MKKVIATILLVGTLLAVLPLSAFAASYQKSILADFSKFYVNSQYSGSIVLRYNPASNGVGVRSSTDVALVGTDMGTAYTKITALNNQERESSASGKGTNGILNSERAIVTGQSYAKKVIHKGTRTVQDLGTNSWQVTCT